MKRAKEYAATLKRQGVTAETVAIVAVDFVQEVKELQVRRHASSSRATLNIIREQDDKWRSLSRMVPSVHPEAFQVAIRRSMPALYEAYTGRAADAV